MNKHFATIIVAINAILVIAFLAVRGWLPEAPEPTREIMQELSIEAQRCRNCTSAIDLSPGAEKLDGKIDDNAQNVQCVLTKLDEAPAEGSRVWFETKNLLFRDVKKTDVDDIYTYASRPEIAQRHCWPRHESKLQTIQLVNYWIEQQEYSYPRAPYAIVEKATGHVIGTGGLTSYNDAEPRTAFGYAISEKSYELEAVRALVELSLIGMEANRISCMVRCDDTFGQEILCDAGLSCEGVEPDYRYCDGAYISLYHYSLLRKEVSTSVLASSNIKSLTR